MADGHDFRRHPVRTHRRLGAVYAQHGGGCHAHHYQRHCGHLGVWPSGLVGYLYRTLADGRAAAADRALVFALCAVYRALLRGLRSSGRPYSGG